MQRSEIPLASNARRARALVLRLGIYLFIFCKGRAEISNLSGEHINGVSQGQLDPEGGSAPYLRVKFYLTVMQLHKSKGIGQTDARTAGPRGKKQLEYLLLILRRDSFARISHGNDRGFAASSQSERDAAALRR